MSLEKAPFFSLSSVSDRGDSEVPTILRATSNFIANMTDQSSLSLKNTISFARIIF